MLIMGLAAARVAAVGVHSSNSLALFQDAIDSGHTVLLEVFIGIAAFALLAQAVAVVGVAIAAMKVQKRGMEIVEEIRGKAMPLIATSHELVTKSHALFADLTPKVTTITSNVEHISNIVKDKVVEFEPTISAANVTVKDANAKTHEQIVRVNGMITTALNATSELANTIHQGIRTPAREVAGIVSGVKASLDSLMSKTRGFGAGIKPNPNRTRPATPPPKYRTESYAGSSAAGTPVSGTSAQVKAAAAAFQRAEKRDLDL